MIRKFPFMGYTFKYITLSYTLLRAGDVESWRSWERAKWGLGDIESFMESFLIITSKCKKIYFPYLFDKVIWLGWFFWQTNFQASQNTQKKTQDSVVKWNLHISKNIIRSCLHLNVTHKGEWFFSSFERLKWKRQIFCAYLFESNPFICMRQIFATIHFKYFLALVSL